MHGTVRTFLPMQTMGPYSSETLEMIQSQKRSNNETKGKNVTERNYDTKIIMNNITTWVVTLQ